jgi:hypothetical protein
MSFQLTGLSFDPFARLFSFCDRELAELDVQRVRSAPMTPQTL